MSWVFSDQALHKISLRESICTLRTCDVLLSLVTTLIDLGVLANKTKPMTGLHDQEKETERELGSVYEQPGAAAAGGGGGGFGGSDGDKICNGSVRTNNAGSPNKDALDATDTETLTLHNTFMDIVVR